MNIPAILGIIKSLGIQGETRKTNLSNKNQYLQQLMAELNTPSVNTMRQPATMINGQSGSLGDIMSLMSLLKGGGNNQSSPNRDQSVEVSNSINRLNTGNQTAGDDYLRLLQYYKG